MAINEGQPPLHIDFDGTAVEKLSKKNPLHWPRNMAKYPLAPIEGFASFLLGARDLDGQGAGLFMGNIYSRRPDIPVITPRLRATKRSIEDCGIGGFFGDNNLVLAGSEENKARLVFASALDERAVGFVEDQPHKFGKELLKHMVEYDAQARVKGLFSHVVLGVVDHPKAPQRIDEFGQIAEQVADFVGPNSNQDLRISGETYRIDVVRLEPYNRQTGEVFAEQVLTAANLNAA